MTEDNDLEIKAMSAISEALSALTDFASRERVLRYALSRFLPDGFKTVDARASSHSPLRGEARTSVPTQPHDGGFTTSLASYIREKRAEQNQIQRFLVAADWLRKRGHLSLTTALVTKSLADNHQKGLVNPSDCLNKNVTKGYCEKTKEGFFITPDGLTHLGSS